MSVLAEKYKGDDLSNIDYEELLELDHQLDLLRIKVEARKSELLMEKENQEETGGLRFRMLWTTADDNSYYHSFDELGLKDCNDRDLVLSGFKRNPKAFPICVGFFCVGDALFMVGGMTFYLKPTNGLWSALAPPDGSFSESWTLCPATMKVKRSVPILVPLHDGRIFICGGTNEREGWAEIYDPKTDEFEGRNLPRMEYPAIQQDDRIFICGGICENEGWGEIYNSDSGKFDCPHPISCFQWTDQVVMVYYHHMLYSKRKYHKPCQPSLLSYNIAQQQWEIFADNLPPPLYDSGKRNLVYVGGDIVFIIDFACSWFVYDLSSKKEAGEVLVKGKKPRGERVPVKGAFYAGNKDIKSTSWVVYIFMPTYNNYCDLGYAKVEVVQGWGGDYFATFQMRGVLRVGPFYEIYIFAEKDKKGKEKIDDTQVNGSLC